VVLILLLNETMNKKFLKAQALAIVMVILVVASIIGVSLFSRMAKDKDSAVNEQDSSIAATQVDAILDFFVGADISNIEQVLGEEDINTGPFTDLGSLANFLESPGGHDELSIVEDATGLRDTSWCPENNSVEVSLGYASEDDYVEVQEGSVMAYDLDQATIDAGSTNCNLTVNLKAIDSNAVFILKKVYRDGSGVVTEDVKNYCIRYQDATPCDDVEDVEYEQSIYPLEDPLGGYNEIDNNHYINIDLESEIASNTVEIRILPIKSSLAVNNYLPDTCSINKQFVPINIVAEATCNQTTRTGEMFLPGSGTLGYSTLFDYGIYDSGLFQP
jgi:hypothetical protein